MTKGNLDSFAENFGGKGGSLMDQLKGLETQKQSIPREKVVLKEGEKKTMEVSSNGQGAYDVREIK